MFETLLSQLLARLLGDYVENLNVQNLRIAIWQGAETSRARFAKQQKKAKPSQAW